MKKLLLSLLCLGAGFLSARWMPDSEKPQTAHSSSPSPRTITKTPSPERPARSLDLKGEWKPAAEAWAKEDPAGFRDWLVENGEPPGNEVLLTLFTEWVKRDPDAAFEAAFNLPGDFNRRDELLPSLLNLALEGPGGLTTALRWIPRVEEQINGWMTPNDEWLKNAPPEVLAAQLTNSNVKKSDISYSATLLRQISRHWAATDPSAALAWMKTLNLNFRKPALKGILESWTDTDSRAALAYLATEATSEDRWNANAPLARLAETDPRAAMDWWEENRGIPDPNCVRHIFGAWCATNAEDAREYVMSMQDPALRRHCLEAWGQSATSDQIIDAVDSSNDPDTRSLLLNSLTSSPIRAAEKLELVMDLVRNQTYPEVTPEMVANLTHSVFAINSPAKGMQWALSLPPDFQEQSVSVAISRWMQTDKIAAARAVEDLPEGPAKTAALKILTPPGKP